MGGGVTGDYIVCLVGAKRWASRRATVSCRRALLYYRRAYTSCRKPDVCCRKAAVCRWKVAVCYRKPDVCYRKVAVCYRKTVLKHHSLELHIPLPKTQMQEKLMYFVASWCWARLAAPPLLM